MNSLPFRRTLSRLAQARAHLSGVLQEGQRSGRRGVSTIPLGDGWWLSGKNEAAEDAQIYPFTVATSEEEIQDLHMRLDQTRQVEGLDDTCFHYGFNPAYLQTVVSHWRNQFDWQRQVEVLNQYPHFKTKIEGLDVHFLRCRPSPSAAAGCLVRPVMLVHGWPGSFFEFYRILPLLLEPQDGLAFEVICPSIPGYGYSQAPQVKGFNTLAAARVFLKLMERLGHSEFYLQGGDWGSIITTNMAQMKPACVRGLHLNMFNVTSGGVGMLLCVRGLHLNMFNVTSGGVGVLLSLLLGPYMPSLVGLTREDVRRLFPYVEKNLHTLLRETGYLHIQATRPDTAGRALNDSPVGLAAYILEKFSCWTDSQNRDLEDGGLERTFSLDDLLTNVMIYWTTRSMTSSMRFYKENFSENIQKRVDSKVGVSVPTGLAAFPQELFHTPRSWARRKFRNILSYSYMPSGGHFAAFEEPRLLANDFREFVRKVEKLQK